MAELVYALVLEKPVPQGLRVRVSSCPPNKYMKVEIQSKKGLRTILSIIVDKKTIQQKWNKDLMNCKRSFFERF